MTDPFFLEVIVNPDVLDIERPFVIAHEWAHLAGYADESEANFVAWLTCLEGRQPGAIQRLVSRVRICACAPLPREDRARSRRSRRVHVMISGDGGPLRSASSPVVRAAASGVYDGYLRANRVERGDRELRRGRQADPGNALRARMDADVGAVTARVLL